ncbi:hypothetical protein [Mariniplasma anaerobium]|uniref:Uncharacterized protein n=1 Tax=Mariniplasma anaerobium TaxID=2735436 RepID=A0A7U9TH25_9MOLU|nr:hypothetical protein [Mariniplasma anaerobium]BCR36245.1 hypothetical protein MPAN_011380 [Mariniplasma anaerobium]
MTKITRKLLLSIITVVLTVVALGTTTFAWFTLTNTSAIQPFEADIVADSGIEVALGAHDDGLNNPNSLNWVTTLTTEAIQTYIESEYNAGRIVFNHVTTTDGVNFMTLGALSMTATTNGYLEIPLNFRSDTANQIDWTSVGITSDADPWTIDVAFTDFGDVPRTTPGTVNVDASNAMRIAMISEAAYGGHTVAYEKPATAANHVLGVGGDLRGPLSNIDGILGNADDYLGTGGSMNYYYEKNNTLPFGADAVVTLATQTVISDDLVIEMVDVSGDPIDYQADFFGQVMIRVWLEGWDANTFNSVLSRTISVQFVFSGVTV